MTRLSLATLAPLFVFSMALSCGDMGSSDLTGLVENFHKVDENLYRSGRPELSDMQRFAELGIKTILTLETYIADPEFGDEEEYAANMVGIKMVRIPMSPLPTNRPDLEDIQTALDVMLDPARQPVLVHCYHGSDRTGIVIGAYHIKKDGWSAEKAIEDMRKFGHGRMYYWWDDILYEI